MGTSCIGPEKEDSPIQIQIPRPPVGKSGNVWLFTFLSKLIQRLSGHFWVKFKEEVIDKDSILLQSLWNKSDPSELMLSFNPLMFCKQCWISSVICWKLLTCGTIWLVLLIHWWNLYGQLLWYFYSPLWGPPSYLYEIGTWQHPVIHIERWSCDCIADKLRPFFGMRVSNSKHFFRVHFGPSLCVGWLGRRETETRV